MTQETPTQPAPVLDYAPPGQRQPSTLAGNTWLGIFLFVYVVVNFIAANVADSNFLSVMFFFGMPAPLSCIIISLGLQFLNKPRPFDSFALIAFIVGVVLAAVCTVWFVGEVTSSC